MINFFYKLFFRKMSPGRAGVISEEFNTLLTGDEYTVLKLYSILGLTYSQFLPKNIKNSEEILRKVTSQFG